MFARLLSLIAFALLVTIAFAKPIRTFPDAPKIPDVSGSCAFGAIAQNGRRVTISGSETWTATGEVRIDGTVRLVWLKLPEGSTAIGIYDLRETQLQGIWGWAHLVEDDECGGLLGEVQREWIRIEE